MKQWQQVQAKRLWEKFDKVIVLEEQKRAQGDPDLLDLLERIRNGKQNQEDMDALNKRYDPQQTLDFSDGRRAITPLNKHRWSLTLHAAIEYGRIQGKKVSLFISDHHWKTRAPSADEIEAVMQLGNDGEGVPRIGKPQVEQGYSLILGIRKKASWRRTVISYRNRKGSYKFLLFSGSQHLFFIVSLRPVMHALSII